ncbi:MAG TPA: hypothetical protein VIV61_14030, partial [Candidatus Ozemobacteraceae bacterium]
RVYLAGTSFLALTDASGSFRIAYVPTGTSFSLMADFNGAVLTAPIPIQAVTGSSAGSPPLPADLILVKPTLPTIPTGTITGTVTRSPFAAGDTDHSGTLVSLTQDGRLVTFTETNTAGVYAFTGVPTTPNNIYNIRFMAPNYVVPATPLSVTVPANGAVTAPSVTLAPRVQVATLGRFTGQAVKQQKYDPAETGSVQMFLATGTIPADTVRYVQISDVNGIFTFAGVPVGSYQLGCADDRYALQAPTTITVTALGNTTPQSVTLVPTRPIPIMGGVSGAVTKQRKYAPAETESVELFLATGTTRFHAVSAAAGAFSFTGIPIGSYQLVSADPGYAFPSPVTVLVATPTNAIPSAFSLVPTKAILGGIKGQVVRNPLIDGEPSLDLIPLKIATGTPGTADYFEMLTIADETGFFAFTGVPIGTYSVFCGDLDYVFPAPTTVQAGNPVIDNGVLTLVPNPGIKGTGVLVATITSSLTAPTRVLLVSQVSPANNREDYAVPLVAGSLSFRIGGLVPGNYEVHIDRETGWDIDPMGPQTNIVNITENAVTPMQFSTVSILPTITAVATSPTDITVTGSNLNPTYRIEVSHLGREPWAPIPTNYTSALVGNSGTLLGNSGTLLGGRYRVRAAVATSTVLV